MFTELKKPRTPRVMYWDLEIQGIIADVDCYVRADPEGRLIHDAHEALLLAKILTDQRVGERRRSVKDSSWLNAWLVKRGGMRLYARRECGIWTWDDWNAIVPAINGGAGTGLVPQRGRPRGHSSHSSFIRDFCFKGTHKCSYDWSRDDVVHYLGHDARAAQLSSVLFKPKTSERCLQGREFMSRPCPPLSVSMLTFADELTASSDNGWCPAPDTGSFVHASQVAPWRGGLVRSPLADRYEADAPLAVAVLVDTSGSTCSILDPLWLGACALVKALRDAGHAAALDWWDDLGVKPSMDTRPLLGWHEREDLIRPCSDSLRGGTMLAKSCLPRMARLLGTAPVGVRRACVVVTDGQTDANDRVQFLEAAQAPCVYIVVSSPIFKAKTLLPPETEGWAARIASDGSDIMRDFSGEQLLAGLLQS